MTFSYLPKVIHYGFCLAIFILWPFSLKAAFALFLIYTLTVFVFRKRKIRFRDDQLTTDGLLFSPISGKVEYIRELEEELQILLKSRPWQEMGLHMPLTGEVLQVIREKNIVDKASNLPGRVQSLEFSNKAGHSIKMIFENALFGSRPQVMIVPGDRGKRKVNIGYMPFGGRLSLLLPKDSELMIKIGDDVSAAETVLASLTRNNK